MGEFDEYTVEDIAEMVAGDRPDAMRHQADGWTALESLLSDYSQALRTHIDTAKGSWTGKAAGVYFNQMDLKGAELESASTIAFDNSQAWSGIADIAEDTKKKVTELNKNWQTEKGGLDPEPDDPKHAPDARREHYDVQARELMDQASGDMDVHRTALTDQFPLAPIPHVDLPGDEADPTEGFGPVDTGTPSVPGGGHSGGPGRSGGPDLQSTPAGTTAIPGGGAGPGPVPGAGPTPGGAPPVPFPGTGGLPGRAGGGLPGRAGLPGRGLPGARPSGAQPFTSRTTPTVRPVIGGRPGTNGMAPTNTGRSPNAITKPVIGSRPGQGTRPFGVRGGPNGRGAVPGRGGAPSTSGRGGVPSGRNGLIRNPGGAPDPATRTTGSRPGITTSRAGNSTNRAANPQRGAGGSAARAVRTPPPKPAATRTPGVIGGKAGRPQGFSKAKSQTEKDKLSGRHKNEGGDETFWTPPKTVPGVITSRPQATHDPGPATSLISGRSTAGVDDADVLHEHRTVHRLKKTGTSSPIDEPLWASPVFGRGVISSDG